MSRENNNTKAAEQKVAGYSAAGRMTAYGNTVRIVWENVLWRPNRVSASAPERQALEDERTSLLADALVE